MVNSGTAYLTVRNIVVRGVADDGFGLYGGTNPAHDIVYQNIMGYQNFDEGFSAHGLPRLTMTNAIFWANDNGIGNEPNPPLGFTARNLYVFSNLGMGSITDGGQNTLDHVRVWDNGLLQVRLGAQNRPELTPVQSTLVCTDVGPYAHRWPVGSKRPWKNYQENNGTTTLQPEVLLRTNPLPATCPTPAVRPLPAGLPLIQPTALLSEILPIRVPS